LWQRFKQNVASASLIKKKTGFTVYKPCLLLHLHHRWKKQLGSSLDPGVKKCFEAAGDSKEF